MQPVVAVLKGDLMRVSIHRSLVLAAVGSAAGALAVPAALGAAARPPAGPWCAATIRINTQYGTMKNKRYLPYTQVSAKARIAVMEAALKQRAKYLAITPAEIKTAVSHELAYYARLKANHYVLTTSSAPMTAADINKLVAFQKTRCGIRFS
jgi:hypothetical protein